MFSAYMQEVHIKVLLFSIYLFTYISVLDPMQEQGISVWWIVELCLGIVVSEVIILLHTHTLLSQNFTNRFFSHHLQFKRDILAASLSRTEADKPLLSSVTVYRIVPSSSVYIYEEESRVYTYFFRQGKSN
jgi:hypothetical protein